MCFRQIPIAEADRRKTAFRDSQGRLSDFIRAGFGLTVLLAALTRIVKGALGKHYPDVVSWMDDILISGYNWQEQPATIIDVVTIRYLKLGCR